MASVRARRGVSDDRQPHPNGAVTPMVRYHRRALLLAVWWLQARHHATSGRFHASACSPATATGPLRLHQPRGLAVEGRLLRHTSALAASPSSATTSPTA